MLGGGLAVVLLGAIAAVLMAPVRVTLDLATEASVPLRIETRWLLWRWSFPRATAARTATDPPYRPSRRRRPARRWRPRLWAALRTPGLFQRLCRLFWDVLRRVMPRTLDGVIRVGLDDPAATGMVFGALAAVSAGGLHRLRVEPWFDEPSLAIRAHAEWVVAPIAIVAPLTAFLAAPVVWRGAWAAWRA